MTGGQASWHGIISASSPRVASQYSLETEPESLERSVFAESLQGILGACGSETAGRRLQRRYAEPVELDQQDERCGKHLAEHVREAAAFSRSFHGLTFFPIRVRMVSISEQMSPKSMISLLE